MLSTNEGTQADWVAQNGPVTFGMKVIKQMYSYRSGVFEPSRQDCEVFILTYKIKYLGKIARLACYDDCWIR